MGILQPGSVRFPQLRLQRRPALTHSLRLTSPLRRALTRSSDRFAARRPAGDRRNRRVLLDQKERITLKVGRVCRESEINEERAAAIRQRGHTYAVSICYR